jgi:hypothetical protein
MTKRILLLAAVFGLGAIAQSNVYAQAAATPTPAAGEAASPAAGAKKGTSHKHHKHHKAATHQPSSKKETPTAASPSPAAQ